MGAQCVSVSILLIVRRTGLAICILDFDFLNDPLGCLTKYRYVVMCFLFLRDHGWPAFVYCYT